MAATCLVAGVWTRVLFLLYECGFPLFKGNVSSSITYYLPETVLYLKRLWENKLFSITLWCLFHFFVHTILIQDLLHYIIGYFQCLVSFVPFLQVEESEAFKIHLVYIILKGFLQMSRLKHILYLRTHLVPYIYFAEYFYLLKNWINKWKQIGPSITVLVTLMSSS